MTRWLSMLVCLLALLPGLAAARLVGPLEVWQQPAGGRDLPEIRRSGELRVLVNQSRNASGEVKGEAIGVEALRLRAFVQYLNRRGEGRGEIVLKLVPKPKDQLLAALLRGEGDLVAPGERLDSAGVRGVARSRPVVAQVPLVLVGAQGGRRFASFEQLSGRSLALAPGSAAGQGLARINEQLMQQRRSPIAVEWVDASLAVEDVLEMVQAGIYPATVVELPIARRWARVMPRLRIEQAVTLGEPADMHWFFRREASLLQAAGDGFLRDYRPPANVDAGFERVYRRLYKVHYPLDRTGRARLEKVRPALQQHAEALDFDWLGLAALAFKESTFNPAARGAGGAVGLMQVMPETARSVGVTNLQSVDGNVLASARYLARIRKDYFSSPRLNERERMAFILAAYNIGPQRVQSLRAEARRRGLNPDQWFFQVERLAMETLGMGVVSYVNAVNKYYVAFARERYLLEAGTARSASR